MACCSCPPPYGICRNREIPNLIPALLLLCGLIGFRPAASVAGLFLVGGPFLLAAVLIKRDGFAIGGGDMKLMGACGFVLGVWPGLIQAVLSLSLAVLVGLVECRLQKQPLSMVRLPLAPFFCFGGVSAYWADCFYISNLNKWRYQIEQEYFSEPDGHRRGVHPAGGSGLLWDHTAFQRGG